jgi:Na+/proline symporter
VLQLAFFDALHIPFAVNVLIIMGLIWLYTYKGGIRTIIWTDSILAIMFLTALFLTVVMVMNDLNLGWSAMIGQIRDSGLGKVFFLDDFGGDKRHFIKYFLGGMFITITMTGLDQDLMQKNLSCKTLKDSQKNMTWFSLSLVPINLLFLTLGALLILFARSRNLELPAASDNLFPMIAMGGFLPQAVGLIFIAGLVGAAFSSSDSALTALTTSVTIDILEKEHAPEEVTRKVRYRVHILLTLVFLLIILLFRALNNRSIIDTIFTIAGYTYGPLLGLYAFGMFTRFQVKDKLVPAVVVLAPVLTFLIQHFSKQLMNYVFSFELLLINGLLTFFFLWLIRRRS